MAQRLHLMRLGAATVAEMSGDYVREVFDQYAARFDDALTQGLAYRGPELLLAAVRAPASERRTHALRLGARSRLRHRAWAARRSGRSAIGWSVSTCRRT